MAAKVEYGTSGKDVLAMQKFLNAQFGKYGITIPEDGTFGDEMARQVNDLSGKIGYNADVKSIDPRFMAACKEALEPRGMVDINGMKTLVNRAQFAKLQAAAGAKAGDQVQKYVSMAEEAKMYWDAHQQARDNNWLWSSVVEGATGAKFPSPAVMNAALSEAKAFERDARACKLSDKDIGPRTEKIRQAFADISQYREELFAGGDQLVKNLETIQTGCIITLQVTGALLTGGMSWQVQVGVSTGLATYEAVLGEVNKASKEGSYSIEKGVARVFLSAVVEAAVGRIIKGHNLGGFMDDVAKKAVEEAGSKWLKKFAVNALNGAAQQMIEDGIKALPGLADPEKKFDMKDFVTAAAMSFVKGAGLKVLGPVCDKYGKSAGKLFSKKDLEGIAKGANLDKAGEEAIKKAIDQIAPRIVQDKIDNWDPAKSPDKLEEEIRRTILDDNTVRREAQEAAKRAKK